MTIRRTLFTFSRIAAGVAAAAIVSVGGDAHAQYFLDEVPGTECKASNISYLSGEVEYHGRSIKVRDSASSWDYNVVTCPISRFVPGHELLDIYVILGSGDLARYTWCELHRSGPGGTDFAYASVSWVTRVWFSGERASEAVSHSVRCLLYPGTSIEEIELIWDRR